MGLMTWRALSIRPYLGAFEGHRQVVHALQAVAPGVVTRRAGGSLRTSTINESTEIGPSLNLWVDAHTDARSVRSSYGVDSFRAVQEGH